MYMFLQGTSLKLRANESAAVIAGQFNWHCSVLLGLISIEIPGGCVHFLGAAKPLSLTVLMPSCF